MSPSATIKRGVVIAFMAVAVVGLMFGAVTGPVQADEPVSTSDVEAAAGTTYDKYNCYVQWYNTYGKNVCGAASNQPNGWVSLSLWCQPGFDYVGPKYHMKKGQQKDPIGGSDCTFSVGGGQNTWS